MLLFSSRSVTAVSRQFKFKCVATWSYSDVGRIPYWPMDAILSLEELNEFLTRLENRYSSRKAEDPLYARLVRACGNAQALEQGRRLHKHVRLFADDRSLFLGNRLVTMYRRCGSVEEARETFDRMQDRDVVTWTAMISAYAENGYQAYAVGLYREMLRHEQPNRVTFLAVLGACDSPELLEAGEEIHAQVREMKLESDIRLGNALINMYNRCRSLRRAMQVFEEMPERDLITWNTAISANAEPGGGGNSSRALLLFRRMQLEGIVPDKVTFISSLNACTAPKSLRDGRIIHGLVVTAKVEPDVVVATALVAMYGRCGSLEDACSLFQRMPEKNIVSWNAMITGYVQFGQFSQALRLYHQLSRSGLEPMRVTYITVLSAITSPEGLPEGRRIHASIVKAGLHVHVEVGNAMVAMYGRAESLEEARSVFDSMHGFRDLITWNAMISAYALSGTLAHTKEAVELFKLMRLEKVVPNKVTFLTALNACAELGDLEAGKTIHALSRECGFGTNVSVCNASMHLYSSCQRLTEAMMIFKEMAQTGRDIVSWNTAITGNVQCGKPREALFIFRRMQLEGMRPNQVTFISVLSVCDFPDALPDGQHIHACVKEEDCSSDPVVSAALVNMYGKCGELVRARELFDKLERENRVLVSWNSMISVYALHGCAKEAFHLFDGMQREGASPDQVTYVALLKACILGGALSDGRTIHERIVDSGFETDTMVGNALVNMYSKFGGLGPAYEIFTKIGHKDIFSWNGMIAGYAHNGHAKLALKFLWLMQQDGVKPDAITFMSTLSACSHAGLVGRGGDDFVAMAVDYQLERGVEHYGCMIDMLGRAGRVVEAEYLATRSPLEKGEISWMTLLAACEVHGDVERARKVAGSLVESNPGNSSAYVALSNMYATCERLNTLKPKLRKRTKL